MKPVFILSLAMATPLLWQNDDYSRYTSEAFFERADVQQKIDPDRLDEELLNAAVFYASNEARLEKRKTPLAFDQYLKIAASLHSDVMEKEGFIGHENSQNRELRTPMMRIEKAGGNFNATAENIARVNVFVLGPRMEYFTDKQGRKTDRQGNPLVTHSYASLARMIVNGWMDSKGHRKNLLGEYDHLGCGVSVITYSRQGIPEILITQNFGKK
ncbi:MAG: CAP domain-containing protein [Owenweeksia sp.]